jgi:hypothetical protein
MRHASSSGQIPRRWVMEVAHSWFNRLRRLLTRTEKQASH